MSPHGQAAYNSIECSVDEITMKDGNNSFDAELSPSEIELLRAIPPFADLPEDAFRELIPAASGVNFQKNSIIFEDGSQTDCFYVIAEGAVRLFRRNPDGKEACVRISGKFDSFGESGLFLDGANAVSAQAIDDCRLVRIDAAEIAKRVRSESALAQGLLTSMSNHVRELMDEIALLRISTASQRVVEYLLRLATSQSRSAQVTLPYRKSVVAQHLNITPEVLSRSFAELRPHGVSVDKSEVRIESVERLKALLQNRATCDA